MFARLAGKSGTSEVERLERASLWAFGALYYG